MIHLKQIQVKNTTVHFSVAFIRTPFAFSVGALSFYPFKEKCPTIAVTFFFFRLQSSLWSVHFLEIILKPPTPKAKSGAKANLVQRFPLFFFTFQGNLQNRKGLKESPLSIFFGTVRLFFENFFVAKGPGPPFIFYFFNVTYKNGWDQRVPPFNFFSALWEIFFEIFFVSKGSAFNFFDILQQTGSSKSPKCPPFYNFRHCEIFRNDYFLSLKLFFFSF